MSSTIQRVAVVLATSAPLCCASNQTGDEGDAGNDRPTEVVDNGPDEGDEPYQQEPVGELDICQASTWTHPDEPKQEAGCEQKWDTSGSSPVLYNVCSCDFEACPLHEPTVDDGDPSTPPQAPLSDCVIESSVSSCEDALTDICGLEAGQHGYCEARYDALGPTSAGQVPLVSFTVVCFAQEDRAHSCLCPSGENPLDTSETNCARALLMACQTPCESPAGSCEPSPDGGYDCDCSVGFSGSVETGLCDYALFLACE